MSPSITSASAPATNGASVSVFLGVADDRQPGRGRFPGLDIFRRDLPSIGQDHRLADSEARAQRPGRNAERVETLGQQMAAPGRLEQVTEALRLVMADGEAAHAIAASGEHRTRFERDQADRHRGPAAWPDASRYFATKPAVSSLPWIATSPGRSNKPRVDEQAAETEHMIEMRMRQQDVIEAAETSAGAQQLPLRALAAIDQEALAASAYQQRRQTAL